MPFFKQPLVQFLLIGVVIYLLYLLSGAAADSEKTIVVTRDDLLTFMQYRSRAFDEERATRAWDVLTAEDIEQLTDDYVREEALYREARSLGLARNDYVIRQRLVQKMEFLTAELSAEPALTGAFMRTFFEDNRQDYFVAPAITLTHIFFREDGARRAGELSASLADVDAAAALPLGDRFPYHRHYSDASPEEIRAHFGSEFADAVFALETGRWQGPLSSAYGVHLVLVGKRSDGRQQSFEEVFARVEQDARRALEQQQQQQAVDELVASYDIVRQL